MRLRFELPNELNGFGHKVNRQLFFHLAYQGFLIGLAAVPFPAGM